MVLDVKIGKKMENFCFECNNSTNFISDYSTGDIICGECGLVIKEKIIDPGQEWRAYNGLQMKKKARTGTPESLTLFDKGLSTIIDSHNVDSNGNKITGKKQIKVKRLRSWNRRSRLNDRDSRNLSTAMNILDRFCSQLRIPNNSKKRAAYLYRKARKSGKLKGRNITGMMAAALYTACRLDRNPFTLKEFAKFSKLNKKTLQKFYRLFIRTMKLKVPPLKPEDYVPKFCSSLNLSMNIQHKTNKILKELKKANLNSGRSPTKIAAAAIYIAAILGGEKRSQRAVAETAGSSGVTIRSRYKEIINTLDIDLEV